MEVVKELLANNASLEHRDMVREEGGHWVQGIGQGHCRVGTKVNTGQHEVKLLYLCVTFLLKD